MSLLKKKETPTVLITKKNCSSSTTVIGFSSSGTPAICAQPVTGRPCQLQWQTHHREDLHISPTWAISHSTSMPIIANDHNQDTSTRRFTAFNSHNTLASTSSSRNRHQPPSVTIIVAPATVTNQHRQQSQPQQVAHTSSSRSSSAAAHQPAHPLLAIDESDL